VNTKTLALIAALTAASVPASAGTFLGLRLNFGGPVYAPAPVVYEPPPTVIVERTPAPGPGYVWIAGHWDWDGRGWVWHNGSWQLPPQASAQWSPGHWMKSSQGWAWADGAWIVPTPPPPATAAPQPPAPPPPMADDVVVAQPPPPPIAETIPLCPSPDYVWIGGSWAWRGSWVWSSGYYFRRPVGQVAWVPGYWDHRASGWGWNRGHWR
jgi:hypothetical protein